MARKETWGTQFNLANVPENHPSAFWAGAYFLLGIVLKFLFQGQTPHTSLQGNNSIEINSTCTVFAESEVISLLTAGISLEDIARAIHEALLKKLVALLSKVTKADSSTILFVGGGAKNNALVQFLSAAISKQVLVPEYPDFYGAYGAALNAKILSKSP